MKVAIIINGISRKKKKFYKEIYPALAKKFALEVFETQQAGDAIRLASEAVKNAFDYILAAGGDGTLNQIVNGVMQTETKTLPVIGLIPLGTGNDFARMCTLKANAQQIISLIENKNVKLTDVGKITCVDLLGNKVSRYFINVCSLGMGPATVDRLEKSKRVLGPTLTYLKAITTTFFTHKPEAVIIKTDTWNWQGKLRVLAIANGQTFGNAIYIAPEAKPDDGLFSTFLAGELPLLKFLWCLQTLKAKKKVIDKQIEYNTCQTISLNAPQICALEAEGELQGYLPATIEVMPNAIKFLRY